MLTSMTGFGRAELSLPRFGRATVEIRTLNHRFLEIECRLPEGCEFLEEAIREKVRRSIHRGHVRISVNLRRSREKPPVSFEVDVAREYVRRLRLLSRQLHIPAEIPLGMILGLPQVITQVDREGPAEKEKPLLQAGISRALSQVVEMRQQEGRRLGRSIVRFIQTLGGLQQRIERRHPISQGILAQRLSARIRVLAKEADRETVAAEAASLVQANDVSEELTRIASHLAALRKTLQGTVESPGRTIDFLAQELHREVNTLGTKARDGLIARWVVTMKNQIERLREQASNIE